MKIKYDKLKSVFLVVNSSVAKVDPKIRGFIWDKNGVILDKLGVILDNFGVIVAHVGAVWAHVGNVSGTFGNTFSITNRISELKTSIPAVFSGF